MSDSEEPIDTIDDVGDDLFGDDGGADALSEIENGLSDQELASDRGDGARRRDARDDSEEPTEYKEKLIAGVPLYRHRIPKSHDGGVSHCLRGGSLKFRQFANAITAIFTPCPRVPQAQSH
jgi:RNA polymerase-associated protein LEO1